MSIDYGGIFNSGILGMPIYQLNESDSIISSDLYERLKTADFTFSRISFLSFVSRCKAAVPEVIKAIPNEWGVNSNLFANKLDELFDVRWLGDTWETYKNLIEIA